MEIKQTTAKRIIGKPYLSTMMDSNGSFTSAWQEMQANGAFAKLDQLPATVPNRTTLTVYGTDSFVFWIGVLTSLDVQVPAGFNHYDLANQTVVFNEDEDDQLMVQIPRNYTFEQFAKLAEKAKIELPEHLGQTSSPYFLETFDRFDENSGFWKASKRWLYVDQV